MTPYSCTIVGISRTSPGSRVGFPGLIGSASGGDKRCNTCDNVSKVLWSELFCHFTQSSRSPSLRLGRPSRTLSLDRKTTPGSELGPRDWKCLAGSQTAKEPSTRAYTTIPGIVGRSRGTFHDCESQSKAIGVRFEVLPGVEISNVIFGSDLRASSRGTTGLSASAHSPVKLHHAHSSKKVFPRPLSPVIMVSLCDGLKLSFLLGPIPASSRKLRIPPSSGRAS